MVLALVIIGLGIGLGLSGSKASNNDLPEAFMKTSPSASVLGQYKKAAVATDTEYKCSDIGR